MSKAYISWPFYIFYVLLYILISLLENMLNEDGSVDVPEVLQPYMGGTSKILPQKGKNTLK